MAVKKQGRGGRRGSSKRASTKKRTRWFAKGSRSRRILNRVLILLLALAAIPVILTPVYRFANPPVTALMLTRLVQGYGIERQWRDIDQITPALPQTVLMSEDGQFCSHSGVDWGAVREVFEEVGEGGDLRGASTITMQLVKNLFLWPINDFVRKVIEIPLAYYADFVLPKRRIMEIYLNIVEWGPGIYGAEAAANHHFNKQADGLSRQDAGRLAAVLPNPIARSAKNPGPVTRRIAQRAAQRGLAAGAYIKCLEG